MTEQTPAAKPKPPRSPVERAIVWGVIGIGLLVIAVEANAHLTHTAAYDKLHAQLDEIVTKHIGMTKKSVDKIVGNKVPETQKLGALDTAMAAARVDIYTYPGLLKSRKLYIYYGVEGKETGKEAEVMDVTTTPAPTAAEAEAKRPPSKPDTDLVPGAPAAAPADGKASEHPKAEEAAAPSADAKPDAESKSDESPAADAPAKP